MRDIKKGMPIGCKKGNEKGHQQGYERGYQKGYEKAEKEWKIWFYCKDCGKKVFIESDSHQHMDVLQYMWNAGWKNSDCQ